MSKKVRCLIRPTQARQDAPFHGQAAAILTRGAYSYVCEHGKRATCLREAVPAGKERSGLSAVALAKPGGFFQYPLDHGPK